MLCMCVLVKGKGEGNKRLEISLSSVAGIFSMPVINSVLSVHKRTYMHMWSIDKRSVAKRRRAGGVLV